MVALGSKSTPNVLETGKYANVRFIDFCLIPARYPVKMHENRKI